VCGRDVVFAKRLIHGASFTDEIYASLCLAHPRFPLPWFSRNFDRNRSKDGISIIRVLFLSSALSFYTKTCDRTSFQQFIVVQLDKMYVKICVSGIWRRVLCWRDINLSEESAVTNFKPEEWLHFTYFLSWRVTQELASNFGNKLLWLHGCVMHKAANCHENKKSPQSLDILWKPRAFVVLRRVMSRSGNKSLLFRY